MHVDDCGMWIFYSKSLQCQILKALQTKRWHVDARGRWRRSILVIASNVLCQQHQRVTKHIINQAAQCARRHLSNRALLQHGHRHLRDERHPIQVPAQPLSPRAALCGSALVAQAVQHPLQQRVTARRAHASAGCEGRTGGQGGADLEEVQVVVLGRVGGEGEPGGGISLCNACYGRSKACKTIGKGAGAATHGHLSAQPYRTYKTDKETVTSM